MDRSIACVLLMTMMTCGASAAAVTDTPRALTRVRGADTGMHRLIVEGDARSPTFRALVDEIQQPDAVVMVRFGACANGRFRSCVSHVAGDERRRHISILVNTRTTGDRLVATIAHELQHAVEIIREHEINDADGVLALYRRIGNGKCRQGLSAACDTDAASVVERRVLEGLFR